MLPDVNSYKTGYTYVPSAITKDTLAPRDKDFLKVAMVGTDRELQDLINDEPECLRSTVGNGFISTRFLITDLGWHYGLAYCEARFTDFQAQQRHNDRLSMWSNTIDNVNVHLLEADQVNAYMYAMAKARLELPDSYNVLGYAFGGDRLSPKQLQRLNLTTLTYALENEMLPVNAILRIGQWPEMLIEQVKVQSGANDKELRKQVIKMMKLYT